MFREIIKQKRMALVDFRHIFRTNTRLNWELIEQKLQECNADQAKKEKPSFLEEAFSLCFGSTSFRAFEEKLKRFHVRLTKEYVKELSLKTTKKVEKTKINGIKTKIFFPEQFEAQRELFGFSSTDFIRSVMQSQSWGDVSGGKSKATFFKTHDDLFVVKAFEKKEFFMFIDLAPHYFEYMEKNKRNTFLAKVYAAFTIRQGASSIGYIVMENLYLGTEPEKIRCYDLKGSEKKRWNESISKKTSVGMDTNFRLERNSEFISLEKDALYNFHEMVERDSMFLAKNNIVDYSLLVILGTSEKFCRFGIIDYFRKYTLDKQIEHYYKKINNFGELPTICKPDIYQTRFINMMRSYFVEF